MRVAKGMAARNGGRIINIASDAGRVGSTGEVVYSGCKGAPIAFAKALARELARNNVLINAICPGPTDTPAMDAFVGSGEQGQKIRDAMVRSVPLGRIGRPGDYAGLAAFLASEEAVFMTGQRSASRAASRCTAKESATNQLRCVARKRLASSKLCVAAWLS